MSEAVHIETGKIKALFNTQLTRIEPDSVYIKGGESETERALANDLVYIFAGGELPTDFLQKAGIQITKRFGYTMRKH